MSISGTPTDGDDVISMSGTANGTPLTIDLLGGNDVLSLGWTGYIASTITSGAGSDTIRFTAGADKGDMWVNITDFTPGDGGDAIDIMPFIDARLSRLDPNYVKGTDPFASGYLELHTDVDGTVELIAGGYPVIKFAGVDAADFTAFNFSGLNPSNLTGNSGDDNWFGTTGNDVAHGGAGNDNLHGGDGNDTIYGDDGNDYLYGDGGNDLVCGGTGDDHLWAGTGTDVLDGGAGNDVLIGTPTTQFIGGDGIDTMIISGDFTNVALPTDVEQVHADYQLDLTYSQLEQFSSLSGQIVAVDDGTGVVDLTANRANGVNLTLGDGDDVVTLVGNSVASGYIASAGGNDHLIGGENADSLDGGAGNDRVEGRGGDDILGGGNGRDVIDGGAGNDTLIGGSDADKFLFKPGSGNDIIADFIVAQDAIDIRSYGFTSFDQILSVASQVGSDVVIQLDATDSITLQNVDLARLASRDFVGLPGGIPTIQGSIIPTLPDAPTVVPTKVMVTVDTYDQVSKPYTVLAGDTVYSTSLPALFGSNGLEYMSPFTNNGTVWNDVAYDRDDRSNLTMTVTAIGAPEQLRGVINNGLLVLHLGPATTVNAIAFEETGADNHGDAYVINEGNGNAWFLSSFLTGPMVNSGLIAVQARHGMAFGYMYENTGSFDNQGGAQLLVEGMAATTAFYSRFGSYLNASPTQITNEGTIIAHSLDHNQPSVGLDLEGGGAAGSGSQQQYQVTNSGLLSADIAIYGGDNSFTTVGDVLQHVVNTSTGEIDGLIYLQRGDDSLDNAGLINGDVDMGLGNDSIDTSAGRIVGHVDLGDGDDSFIGGAYHDDVVGGSGNDTISGGAGDDDLNGGTGNDVIDGGDGIDYAWYDSADGPVSIDLSLTTAQDTGAAGVDTLTNIEGIVGTGFDDHLVGNDAGNQLYGQGGNDSLAGGAGDDFLVGGAGNDQIDGGAGVDIASYAWEGHGVTVSLEITGAQNTGLAGTDILNNIEGLDGSDYADTLTGDVSANLLFGNRGDDTLDGGGGADTMAGGAGNDIYVVDNAHDVVTEERGEGIDTVRASIGYTLGSNIENLVFTGSQGLVGTGNDLDNVLTGSAGADKLIGGFGNDMLDGAAGNDRLIGGAGDDVYRVDSYSDAVTENAGEGSDTVISTANFKLHANVENLMLSGSASIWGYGNELDNALSGNDVANKLYGLDGNDTIDGKGGIDLMFGGVGDDTYIVDAYGDRAIEKAGEGTDSVLANADYKLGVNVENLTLTGTSDVWGYGNAEDNLLTGNDGANKLYGLTGSDTLNGGNGNDWLEGGSGQDHLTGGAGADSFVFRNGDFGGATVGTADEITDFTHGEDHIRLNYVDANSTVTGDPAFAFMGTSAFDGHAGELRYEQISGDTYVEGDTNGDGIADFMIRVDGLHTLTSGDFAQ